MKEELLTANKCENIFVWHLRTAVQNELSDKGSSASCFFRYLKLIHMRLKNSKRKGMPFYTLSHHLLTVPCTCTYTLRLSILHEGLELLLPEFQTAIFVKVSCQSVPYCCRVKNADICRNQLCRTYCRKQSRGE